MWGKADETEYLPKTFGLDATVVAVSLNGKPKTLAAVVRGEKHGWHTASQTLHPGKSSQAYVSTRLFCGATRVAEGAAKSANLQSIGARWAQAAAI